MGRGLLHEPRAVGDRPGPLSPGGSFVDPVHHKLLGGCRERRGPGRRYRGAGRLSIGRDAASGMHLPTSDAGLACREGRCTWKAGQLWRQDRMRHRHRVPMRAGYPRPCGENNGALHNESRGRLAPSSRWSRGSPLPTGRTAASGGTAWMSSPFPSGQRGGPVITDQGTGSQQGLRQAAPVRGGDCEPSTGRNPPTTDSMAMAPPRVDDTWMACSSGLTTVHAGRSKHEITLSNTRPKSSVS